MNKFGFNKQGDKTSNKLLGDGKPHVPQYDSKEDEELGIDRSLMDPVKFVSAIDSKPIFPPYLKLADFETFLKQEATRQQVANAKEKKGEQAQDEKEHLEDANIQKQKNKPHEDINYPDALEKEL